MTQEVEPFPVDYDTLAKGDLIAAERCEQILNLTRLDERYQLKLLRLKETICDAMEKRGVPITIRIEKAGLAVLTDAQAAEYNPQQFELGIRKAATAHRRTLLVDNNNLTIEEQQKLNRRSEIQGRMLQAVQQSRKLPEPEPHKRLQ